MTGLQGSLQAEQTALQALSRFATTENVQVQAAEARIASLKSQIAAAQADEQGRGGGPSLGGLTPQLIEYENLYRNERFAEAEYDIYKRYLSAVTVEELSAPINMDVLEPPFILPERQLNTLFVGALAFIILLAVLAEFYIASPNDGKRR